MKNNKNTVKDKSSKIQLKLCYDDLIKDEFWEIIKLG